MAQYTGRAGDALGWNKPPRETIMNYRKPLLCTAAVLLLTASTLPVQAQAPLEKDDAIAPLAILKDIIREDDVTLVFKHLRESIAAAARGEEAQPSEAFKSRSEQLQRDLTQRGGALIGALLNVLEAQAGHALREALRDTREPAGR